MPFTRSLTAVALTLFSSVLVTTPATAAPAAEASGATDTPTAGGAGAGDPFFPLQGNGGYDVSRYRLRLDWEPTTKTLTGSERIFATATQSLSSFNLDLRGMTVSQVLVNDRAATFSRDDEQELTITPGRALADGAAFTVSVEYAGTPEVVIDPDGSAEGWVPTSDGVFVVGEPQGSPTWFAVNDTPIDKALYDVTMTVPEGLTAVGNGKLVVERTANGRSTFQWVNSFPMASYLSTITIGNFEVTRGPTRGQVPTYIAVDPSQAEASAPVLAKLPSMVRYFAGIFGRYPFETVGAIVDDAPDVGYALETQTKPVFDRAPDEATLAHELAHQWFGDAVTLSVWPDIWLNEGFATYSEWLWGEHAGGATTADRFAELLTEPADSDLWNPPTNALVTPDQLFGGQVYDRGAMTLQALRVKIGDGKFFQLLRTWYVENRNGNVTTADFIALSEKISGQELDPFFDTWIFSPTKPTSW